VEHLDKEELISFEKDLVQCWKDKKIRSPFHLSGGNEDQLIEIFKDVKPQDWIFTTYRSHYHALLKGVSKEWLKQWVLDNKSIHVMNKEHKIVTSAIVGGTLSQAVGMAMAIKREQEEMEKNIKEVVKGLKGEDWNVAGEVKITPVNQPHVWAFLGDMCAEVGMFHECQKYAKRNNLPITFVIEDNGLSTDTPTQEAWGLCEDSDVKTIRYEYQRIWPHYGSGKRIDFDDE